MPSFGNIGNQKPVGCFHLISNVFYTLKLIVCKKVCTFFTFNVFVLAVKNDNE